MIRALFVVLLAIPVLGACAAPLPFPADPPPAHAEFPVTYEARIAGLSPEAAHSPLVEDQLPAEPPPGDAGLPIEVACELVQLDAIAAEALFGWSPADGVARALDHASVRGILDEAQRSDRATTIAAPRLTLFDRQRGTLTIANQTAYISHFDLEVGGGRAVADPVVKVAADGLFLHLRPAGTPGSTEVALDLDMTISTLQRPIAVVEAVLPGSPTPVQIQQPVLCTQRLTTSAALAPSECLVLAAFGEDVAGDRLFAILTARRVTAPIVATVPPH